MMLLFALVDVGANWEPLAAGAGLGAASGWAIHRIIASSNYERRAYRRAGDFDANRVTALETQVQELNTKVTQLEADYRTQRDLKHNWKSFASSLVQERWTIRQFSVLHNCKEITELMDRLDDLRRDNPLMSDAKSMIQGEPT